jgi:DinB superfamily
MKKKSSSEGNNFFAGILEEAYYRKAWHGPNLHSSLNGVTADLALQRPSKDRHNIYEITVHSSYWVYRVMQRIRKNPGVKFPIKGSNWFESPNTLTETEWKKQKKLLNNLHEELYILILDLNEKEFKNKSENEKEKINRLLIGIALHDVYHAGQIQLIKKLIKV